MTGRFSATVRPMGHIGWWIKVHCPFDDSSPNGGIPMQIGPNGGDYMAFGTRRRAERKAKRIVHRHNSSADRERDLTFHVHDHA